MSNSRFWIRAGMIGGILLLLYGFLQLPSLLERMGTQKSISILVWPNIMDAEYLDEFEKETGIKVYLSYFESYEELLVKIKSGISDYDVVMAADYAVDLLRKEATLKPIDTSKLDFWNQLYPALLSLYYDPENRFSIPFAWEIYGLGINAEYYNGKLPEPSWALLFDEHKGPRHVGMLDDAREIVSIAALYLFGKKKNTIDEHELQEIKQLLLRQKKRVAMYTDLRTDYLLVSGAAPVVMGISSDIYNAMRVHPQISFLLPKEGSFMVIDTLLIPASTKKDDLVYQFLNYLYQPHIIKKYADRYNFFPALKGVSTSKSRYHITPTQSFFSRLRFFSYHIPDQGLRELWVALKS